MKSLPKFIVLNSNLYKPATTIATHRFYLLVFFSVFTFTFLLTLLKPTSTPPPPPPITTSATVTTALLHYAAISTNNATAADRMTVSELTTVAATIRDCSSECNVLIFGFSHETLLWKALNYGERRQTVFVDENEYAVFEYERNFTDIEAYDVQYTTKVSKWKEMIQYARVHRKHDCKPVQNLLFSDCKLAINDLPNHLYEIPWDIILIDGPRGYSPKMPGRMAAIFTAGVLGRTQTQRQIQTRKTHVFVHDHGREVERIYSEEFLCTENLVEIKDDLAHFVVNKREENDMSFEFCVRKWSVHSYMVDPYLLWANMCIFLYNTFIS